MVLVLDNIRSLYNVGAILRSAEAFGVKEVIYCGITPYPKVKDDPRPYHVKMKADAGISKTALGAEKLLPGRHTEDTIAAVTELKALGYRIYALEQAPGAKDIKRLRPVEPFALIVGHETEGVSYSVLSISDAVLFIPMYGAKESLNVSVAVGIALYALKK